MMMVCGAPTRLDASVRPLVGNDKPVLDADDAVGIAKRAVIVRDGQHGARGVLRHLGEKQRVAIARSLAGRPSVILADEPTAALDGENGKAVMELLTEVAQDPSRAVLAVTHDHRTLGYADRIIRIEDGVIVGEKRQKVKPSAMTNVANGKIGAHV